MFSLFVYLYCFYKQLDAEDDDDDDDVNYDDDNDYNEENFEKFEEEDEACNYWQLKDYNFGTRKNLRNEHKDHEHKNDDEVDSANPWRKTGGLRLTRNEYHRFCDAQLECNC